MPVVSCLTALFIFSVASFKSSYIFTPGRSIEGLRRAGSAPSGAFSCIYEKALKSRLSGNNTKRFPLFSTMLHCSFFTNRLYIKINSFFNSLVFGSITCTAKTMQANNQKIRTMMLRRILL